LFIADLLRIHESLGCRSGAVSLSLRFGLQSREGRNGTRSKGRHGPCPETPSTRATPVPRNPKHWRHAPRSETRSIGDAPRVQKPEALETHLLPQSPKRELRECGWLHTQAPQYHPTARVDAAPSGTKARQARTESRGKAVRGATNAVSLSLRFGLQSREGRNGTRSKGRHGLCLETPSTRATPVPRNPKHWRHAPRPETRNIGAPPPASKPEARAEGMRVAAHTSPAVSPDGEG